MSSCSMAVTLESVEIELGWKSALYYIIGNGGRTGWEARTLDFHRSTPQHLIIYCVILLRIQHYLLYNKIAFNEIA